MKTKSYIPADQEMNLAYEKSLADLVANNLRKDGFSVETEVPINIKDSGYQYVDILAEQGTLKIAYIIKGSLFQLESVFFKKLINELKNRGYKVKYLVHRPSVIDDVDIDDLSQYFENDLELISLILERAAEEGPKPHDVDFVEISPKRINGSLNNKRFTISGTASAMVSHDFENEPGEVFAGWNTEVRFEFEIELILDENTNEFVLDDFSVDFY